MDIINKVTLRGLVKNKTRTAVTIIGVILSVAMLSAVTTLISSIRQYLIDLTIADEGSWYAAAIDIRYDNAGIFDSDMISEAGYFREKGYVYLEESANYHKPYLYIIELDPTAMSMYPIYLSKGRLPENENEILISEHVLSNADVNIDVGDILEFDIGKRVSETGAVLGQDANLLTSGDVLMEKLSIETKKTYLVTGITGRPSYTLENYSAPGYTVITYLDSTKLHDNDKVNIFYRTVR